MVEQPVVIEDHRELAAVPVAARQLDHPAGLRDGYGPGLAEEDRQFACLEVRVPVQMIAQQLPLDRLYQPAMEHVDQQVVSSPAEADLLREGQAAATATEEVAFVGHLDAGPSTAGRAAVAADDGQARRRGTCARRVREAALVEDLLQR